MSVNKSLSQLTSQTTGLAWAVPQVIAQRLTRMALAGPNPSAKDQHEFYTMGAEKVWAFYESWWAMSLAVAEKNQHMLMSMFMTPWKMTNPSSFLSSEKLQKDALDVMNKGMTPVRKRAVSNARRLSR